MNNGEFEFYTNRSKINVLVIDTRKIDIERYIDLINETGVNWVSVRYADDLNFLLECKGIEFLDISLDYDFTPLYEIKNLKSLMILNDSEKTVFEKKIKLNGKEKYKLHDIDVSRLDCVKLETWYDRNIRNLSEAKQLKSLSLSKYKPQTKDLSEIGELENLDTIELIQCNSINLIGIQKLKKLKYFNMDYMRNLTDINALEGVASTLCHMRISNATKHIEDFSVLAELNKLVLLELSGGGTIPNLGFMKELHGLKTFVFDVDVLDGDLALCKNLSWCGLLLEKRHYNLKQKDLPRVKFIRGDQDIEEWRRIL